MARAGASWFRTWREARHARHRAWWQKRLQPGDTVTLNLRQVFILPTRTGGLFGALLAVLLLASISYQSNLSYLLTFLLASTAASAMLMTTSVLRGMRLQRHAVSSGHAQQALSVPLTLTDLTGQTRYAVGVRWHHASDDQSSMLDVPAHGSVELELMWTPERRGWHPLPWIVVHTHFPLGIFRAWSVWRPASSVLVYPAPEPHAPHWRETVSKKQDEQGRGGLSEETDGVRAYRRGDPLKRVLWKRMAKSNQLISRDAETSGEQTVWLDYSQIRLYEPEARLSRLTAWVLRAHAAGQAYGLRLPGQPSIEPGVGLAHCQRCLQQLALFESKALSS